MREYELNRRHHWRGQSEQCQLLLLQQHLLLDERDLCIKMSKMSKMRTTDRLSLSKLRTMDRSSLSLDRALTAP